MYIWRYLFGEGCDTQCKSMKMSLWNSACGRKRSSMNMVILIVLMWLACMNADLVAGTLRFQQVGKPGTPPVRGQEAAFMRHLLALKLGTGSDVQKPINPGGYQLPGVTQPGPSGG